MTGVATDAAAGSAPSPRRLQRMHGRAEVGFAAGPRGQRLTRLFQQGSAKAMLPRVHGAVTEVVFLNTAGGLTGGDPPIALALIWLAVAGTMKFPRRAAPAVQTV